jgi:hypothetical protein
MLSAAGALHLAIASGRGATLCSLDAPFVEAALLTSPQRGAAGAPSAAPRKRLRSSETT